MATCFLYGNGSGGGNNLNFSVKVYTTEEALLADAPKENTIGVVTDTAVPKWGFYAAAPGAPAEGEIFFTVATESAGSFNALKKNALTVYPALCQQYISATWARKTAYIYKDGVWVQFSSDWGGTLYDSGDEYVDITGGWESYKHTSNVSGAGTVTKGDTYIKLSCTNASVAVSPVNKIDFTDYSELHVNVNQSGMGSIDWAFMVFISDAKNTSTNDNSIASFNMRPAQEYTFDISGVTGEHYISIGLVIAGGTTYWGMFNKVWLK